MTTTTKTVTTTFTTLGALQVCGATFLSFVLVATLGACAPSHKGFLQDAASTCGNPDLVFPEQRTFERRVMPAAVNTNYDCVQSFLQASPEYQNGMTGKEHDAGYIDGLRRIDLARSSGQISAEEAKAEGLRLYQRYEMAIGE